MTDKPLRPQLNIRLDKYPSLLDDIKQAAGDCNTTASEFVIDAILTALGKPTTTTPTDTPSIDAILVELDRILDAKLDKRLGEFERRLLAETRPDDRQPSLEDRQVSEETRPEDRPNHEAMRDSEALRRTADRTLSKLKMGRQSAAGKAIDVFIKELAKLPMPNTQPPDLGNLAVGLLVDLAIAEWRKHKTEMRYFEDLRRIAKLCGYQLFKTTIGYEAKDITTNKFVFNTGEIGAIVEWLRQMSPQISN
jgi:hypothetical protein